ncbi:MAG: ribonuclease P protein component [Firmicutes bacterium]|nr:ribonuclease P protein component [Bacillota bacterium]MBR2783161.1 ribonuclease P protein component [Bacillota bacterium]
MLPGPYRLKRQQDFSRVYKRGVSQAYPAFVLHRRSNGGGRRFGFSVSKKVGNAVTRNRVRRRLRHAVYGLRDSFPPATDYVFVARNAAAHLSFQQLEQQLRRAAADCARPAGGRTARPAPPRGQ